MQSSQKQLKVDRYDRQIRLWGVRGQRNLGTSKVALLKCSGEGIESLKNLVLPGVGSIDIWDDQVIKLKDLSQSFFYQQDAIGKYKAQIALQNLLEMNPQVKGKSHFKNIDKFLSDINIIKQYNLVLICGQLNDQQLKKISSTLWQLAIPCIFIHVIGYFFYVRIQKQIHFVQSSNTKGKKYYLRVSDPFPQLLHYAKKYSIYKQLQKIENKKVEDIKNQLKFISTIPYVLILIQVIEHLPAQSKKNRTAIQKQLNRIKLLIHHQHRENVEEAIRHIFDTLQTPENFMIDIALFDHKSVKSCTKKSHPMQKFLYAASKIYKQSGKLPQPTQMPDMNTTTQNFINLKSIYKQKHKSDIKNICSIITQSFGDNQLDQNLISGYINNLHYLEIVQIKKYAQELDHPDSQSLAYCQHEKDLFISIRSFQQLNIKGQQWKVKEQELQNIAQSLQKKYKIDNVDKRYIQQVFRSQGRSNINIYSIAGALAGQQAIKLLTGCFTPMNSGYLFDGANGAGYKVKL